MMLWLLLALTISRSYQHETIDSLPQSKATHVQVVGKVTLVRHEGDGDWHLRLEDAHGHFIVAEILQIHPLPRPQVGQSVLVKGVHRFDWEHLWHEVHPCEQIEVVK